MELLVNRNPSKNNCTISNLLIDGKFECYVLEDVLRDSKIYGETAIPAGRYKVIVNMSARFKRMLPLLIAVPNYKGVRIHAGNTAKDTLGCLLVGQKVTDNSIVGGTARPAEDALVKKLLAAQTKKEPIFITIKNP